MEPEILGQIYLITNKINWKQYVGQTRTHYRDGNGWKPAGYQCRWNSHIKEAYQCYKHESALLNRSIRKYGPDVFDVELMYTCPLNDLDEWEIYFIEKLETFTMGLNLTPGGKCGQQAQCVKKQISNKLLVDDNDRIKLLDGKDIISAKISKISSCGKDIASITFRLEGDKPLKIDFGGTMQTFEVSLKRCVKFALLATKEEKIIIQRCLQHLVDLPLAQADDRLIVNSMAQTKTLGFRYNKIKNLTIESIYITKYRYKTYDTVLMYIKSIGCSKKLQFGAKFTDFDSSLDDAVRLALMVTSKENIKLQIGLQHNSL